MSSQDTDQVTTRPAAHADCHAIKSIDRNLHSGYDRFLYYFHYDVDVETKISCVAEVSSQIVGYASGHIIDDGETIVMRDVRVTEKHRGKNIMRMLDISIMSVAVARFPNLRQRAWMSSDIEAIAQAKAKHPAINIGLTMPSETFLIHSDELKKASESSTFHTLAKKYQIETIVSSSKSEALKLLTEEIRHLDFAPVRPIIGWQPSGWCTSTLGAQLQVTDLYISRHPDTRDIQAFSFLTTIRSDYGIKTGIEFYCDPRAKVQELTIAHLLHFIRELARFHSNTKVLGYIHHPVEVSCGCVREVLSEQLGIPPYVSYTSNLLQFSFSDQKSQL